MTELELQQLIETGINTNLVKVAGDGKHFTAIVVSDEFINIKLLERQRLVLAALKQVLADNVLHAITIKAFTLSEWQQVTVTEH
jgi:acid stress-induced BolA-like protein IbaG/YrbA